MYLTGVENIRDVIPFPRTPNNCEFWHKIYKETHYIIWKKHVLIYNSFAREIRLKTDNYLFKNLNTIITWGFFNNNTKHWFFEALNR
jgi:hypothetical protein